MTAKSPRLLTLVESFFRDHLQSHCGASPHTITAYRDSLRLFFNYLADVKRCTVADLETKDLQVELVAKFLSFLESKRSNSVASRNCRLAALRSFFKHLLRHDLSQPDQYQRVLALESKRARKAPSTYLEPEDVRAILSQPDQRTPGGVRDYALLLFLYNTGSRISEALAVRKQDLSTSYPKQVRLHGKGKKDRLCPLWRDTAAALEKLPALREGRPGDLVFRNARGGELTRDGAAYILKKYVLKAAKKVPALSRERITPHVLRHSCAAAMLQGGNDITVIRDYLGHASISTTSRYVATNLKLKREALDAFWRRAGISRTHAAKWQPKPDLLRFLNSL